MKSPFDSEKSLTRLILEKTLELGEVTLDAFFPPHYSYTRPSRVLLGLDRKRKALPQTISVLLSRLQKQGLVLRTGTRRKSVWTLTGKGKTALENGNDPIQRAIPPRDDILRLVIFDIPEKERKKRDMLRSELVACNFSQLQKSVWMGYHPLPEEFIELLDVLSLKKRVHIFSVKEKGTIVEDA